MDKRQIDVEENRVLLKKLSAADRQCLQALEAILASEWESEEDHEAYDHL
jgi:hypothetical protein